MSKQEPKDATAAPAAEAVPKGKSKMTLILVALLVLVAGAGGFFGWKYFKMTNAAAAAGQNGEKSKESYESNEEDENPKKGKKGKKDKSAQAEEGGTINFEPFLVNLADKGASRYLKASIRIVVSKKEEAEHIAKGDVLVPKMRDTILSILSSKTAAEITTNQGKDSLKKEILERINEFLPEEAARELFFTDFVVQL